MWEYPSTMTTTDQAQAAPSAVERADALLTLWGQRLTPSGKPEPQGKVGAARKNKPPKGHSPRPKASESAARRADTLLGRIGHRLSGRGLVEGAAYGYVALAIKTGRAADAVQSTWQESVQAARRQQEQQAARSGGASAARQMATDERKGENILNRTATDVAEDVGKDVDAAVSAEV